MLYRLKIATCRFLIITLAVGLFSCNQLPTEADAIKLNEVGISLMNEEKYEQAIASFKEAIQNSRLSKNSKGNIYRNMALAYHEQSIIDSAIHYSTLAAKCFKKNNYDYLLNMAYVDLLKGKTTVARSKLLKAASMNPEDLAVNNSLGLIYLGDYGEEFTDLDKALTYNKKAHEINDSRVTEDILARTYYELGEYENAEVHYDHVYFKYPGIVIYALNTGLTKYRLKKIAEAELLFTKVLTLDSSYRETIENFKANNK
jgi:tetratricopeptide (TPR) repeat protein